ncbi:nuclease domain-containing protein [Halorhodospira sp. 9622]|uniref:nuclease domain-containing protein n=1 Tax=Halorhodospira sp. 9622 TaxID=2899136 RepID=UPI001EE83499|nr:nuclease domain-containing protein [Halorhodospira sp. 9622]MCG5538969.1 DUF1364 domain-containing protein [Halorhodospira sp. 9622]
MGLKRRPIRNRRLLDSARGRPCELRVPGVCQGGTETTVAAHSNWSEDGKAAGQKADDIFHARACAACHRWLDEGSAPDAEKRELFHRGLKRTWRRLIDEGVIQLEGVWS